MSRDSITVLRAFSRRICLASEDWFLFALFWVLYSLLWFDILGRRHAGERGWSLVVVRDLDLTKIDMALAVILMVSGSSRTGEDDAFCSFRSFRHL